LSASPLGWRGSMSPIDNPALVPHGAQDSVAESLVWLVDDDPWMLQLVAGWLHARGLSVIEFTSATALLRHVGEYGLPDQPTCLVSDFRMPEVDGLVLVRELRGLGFSGACVLVSAAIDVAGAVQALHDGYIQVLEKPLLQEQLCEEVLRALASHRRELPELRRRADLMRRFRQLSPREREVLAAAASGMMNKQIADALGVSIKTIESHRSNVMLKLGVRSLAELIRAGIESIQDSRNTGGNAA